MKYETIQDKLINEIRSGLLKPGMRLPAERELARRFRVSPMTARRAVRGLVERGVLESRARDGTYIHGEGGKILSATTLNIIYLGFGQSRASEIIRHAGGFAQDRGWKIHVVRLDGLAEQIGVQSILHGNLSIVLADEAGLHGCIGQAMEEARGRSIVIGNRLDHRGVPSVLADDAAGMRLAVEHLFKAKRHGVALVSNDPEHTVERTQIEAWRSSFVGRASATELDARFIPVNTPRFECPFYYTYKAVTRFLASKAAEIDAMICLTDEMAVAAMAACRDAGRSIPEDVSVVCCGDTALAAVAEPPLTAVDVDIPRHVEMAFTILDGALAGSLAAQPRLWRIQPRLVQRMSVAGYPGAGRRCRGEAGRHFNGRTRFPELRELPEKNDP